MNCVCIACTDYESALILHSVLKYLIPDNHIIRPNYKMYENIRQKTDTDT